MSDTFLRIRNRAFGALYKHALKPVFFINDPEAVHDKVLALGVRLGSVPFGRKLVHGMFGYENPALKQTVLGIDFANPVGLAAGFDKNAELTDTLPSVGFGFMEVGSITGNKCEGNPKPRLWRLPKSQGLVVYYGLKNDGSEAIAQRLASKTFAIPVGTSVAMTNCKENLNLRSAVLDYAKAFKAFTNIGAYYTINISCPNAEGGQPFIAPHKLDYLLDIIDEIPTKKPVFVKLSPDMAAGEIDALLDVLKRHRVHGIICTNLTKRRKSSKVVDDNIPDKGGMSGKVVQDLSDKLLSFIYKREKDRFVLVGCGGIFTAEDAYHKIRRGATLLQMITGMIYQGPQVISEINRGLAELLERDGFSNIAEAVGADHRTTDKDGSAIGKLVIARHHESEWNKKGMWTGSRDIHLTEYGFKMSHKMGELVKGINIDEAFASSQIRSFETLLAMEDAAHELDVPVTFSPALSERDYGDYTGKNKWEMEEAIGTEEFDKLRREWNYPVPNGETLKMVYDRAVPYYLSHILPVLKKGKNVLLVSHGNAIRALTKYIEDITDDEIKNVEMLFGSVVVYDIDSSGKMVKKDIRSIPSQVNA